MSVKTPEGSDLRPNHISLCSARRLVYSDIPGTEVPCSRYTVGDISVVTENGQNSRTRGFQRHATPAAVAQRHRGQGLVEYVLILVLVACGAVAAQQVLTCEIGCALEITGKHIENFMSGGKKIPPGQLKKCSKMCT
jgi:hypothetical protein